MLTTRDKRLRRAQRVRSRIRKAATGRPRLTIFRSNRFIYAQLIDDGARRTIASASSLEKDLRAGKKSGADVQMAGEVGKLLAERALKEGVKNIVFDRGHYMYHGRVKALADAAREAGLSF